MPRTPRTRPPAPSPDAAAIDALYGLEPVLGPGVDAAGLGEFVSVDCPYCGERFATPVDLTAGSFSYVEDCPICCRPIELCGDIGADGELTGVLARRLDD